VTRSWPRRGYAGQPELSQVSSVARRRDGTGRATGTGRMGVHTPPLADRRGFLVHQPLPFHAVRVAREPASSRARLAPQGAGRARSDGSLRGVRVVVARTRRTMPGRAAARRRSEPSAVKARGSPRSYRPRQSRRKRVLFDNRDCRLSVLRIRLPA
jgi:hypothetical protein